MTRGITTPEEYYYTRMFTDAALAVDTARELAGPSCPVAVSGGSQGGALALAAAALRPDVVAVCHADVPFLCDIQRGITLAPRAPYTEVPEFLAGNVRRNYASAGHAPPTSTAHARPPDHGRGVGQRRADGRHQPPSTVMHAAYNGNQTRPTRRSRSIPTAGTARTRMRTERQLRHLRERLPV